MKTFLLILTFSFYGTPTAVTLNNSITAELNNLKKDAKKLALYYRMRVLRGESMASIAKLYSEDNASAINGGLISNITKGLLVAEFEAVAYKLKPNEISEVFETEYGFHFIQLVSRKGDVLSLRHLLITRD